jgi:Protein of unknown function (DUF1571)
MFSSLNSFRLLSFRFKTISMLCFLVLAFQFSALSVSAQNNGGPKLGKPPATNPETSTESQPDSGEFKKPTVKNRSGNKTSVKKKRVHPLVPALKIAKESLKSISDVRDYQAIFYKTELIKSRYVNHQARIKFRENPFSVYMGFEGANKGREVLYVAGRNNGNLIAKEAGVLGLVGAVSLNPSSSSAMAESLFPITDIGMKNLVTKLVAQWEGESKYGECNVKITNGSLPIKGGGSIKCKVIDSKHPRKRRQFIFHHTKFVVDRETQLPVIVEQYGFPQTPGQKAPLLGKYVYVNVKIDIGLKDIDFDVANRNYHFR